jgi:hypothetical protein
MVGMAGSSPAMTLGGPMDGTLSSRVGIFTAKRNGELATAGRYNLVGSTSYNQVNCCDGTNARFGSAREKLVTSISFLEGPL